MVEALSDVRLEGIYIDQIIAISHPWATGRDP
jgi:hypothetical protein